jgi:hypothetical protein
MKEKDVLEYLRNAFRENRGKPLNITTLTEDFYGKPDKNDFRALYFFERRYKIKIQWAIRKLRALTGLHIYKVRKEGYIVLENIEDFDWVIQAKVRLDATLRDVIDNLMYDKENPLYKTKVNEFFEDKKTVTTEEFEKIAKTELLRSRLKKRTQKALKYG